jgi:hypothetical protein
MYSVSSCFNYWTRHSNEAFFPLVLGIPGEPVVVTSEEDIFEYIGYPYKKPSERV